MTQLRTLVKPQIINLVIFIWEVAQNSEVSLIFKAQERKKINHQSTRQ